MQKTIVSNSSPKNLRHEPQKSKPYLVDKFRQNIYDHRKTCKNLTQLADWFNLWSKCTKTNQSDNSAVKSKHGRRHVRVGP